MAVYFIAYIFYISPSKIITNMWKARVGGLGYHFYRYGIASIYIVLIHHKKNNEFLLQKSTTLSYMDILSGDDIGGFTYFILSSLFIWKLHDLSQ